MTDRVNDEAAKARRRRLGAGVDLELELAQEEGIVGDAMRKRLLRRAQDLLWDAWDTPGVQRRVRMAHRALELSPDAADAYVILAMDAATTPREEADLYRKGVDAGLRALGPRALSRYRGKFWHTIQTRPYMRALSGLAQAEWRMGNLPLAVEGCRQLIRLDPDDHIGIRYPLSHILLESGLDNEAHALFETGDLSIEWQYGRALLAFRTLGAAEAAHEAIMDAFMWNPYVVRFFNGKKPLPTEPPWSYREGTVSEAASYVFGAHRSWLGTPGAVEWLLAEDELPKPWRSPKKPQPT